MKSPLLFVLHAHMPWVQGGPEERWLLEAIADCYLPLLDVLQRAARPFHLAVSISPPLLAQLDDVEVQESFRSRHDPSSRGARRGRQGRRESELMTASRSERLSAQFEALNGSVTGGWEALAREGVVTLFTTAATHGYLPLLESAPGAVEHQLRLGFETFQRRFRSRPSGFWLPECGYTPALAERLRAHGVDYTFVEQHAFIEAPQPPPRGIRAPARTQNGLTLFARDVELCARVWSAERGYPGGADYLDFHNRAHGQRWARVGQGAWNEDHARARAVVDARDFVERLERDCEREPGLRVAAFDAELFGHWWFEGPWFLEEVIRCVAQSATVELAAPAECLKLSAHHSVEPRLSSWGRGGYSQVWMNERNAHWWPLIIRIGERLAGAQRGVGNSALRLEAIREARDQWLLAQASDWLFLLDAQRSVNVAARRLETHLSKAEQALDAFLK